MPFIKREIKPVKIRQGALDKSDISLGEEHEVIVNKSYTQILQQISQLATFSNEIFRDLSQECHRLVNRSHKLKTRVWEIEQRSEKLNVLEIPLRELAHHLASTWCTNTNTNHLILFYMALLHANEQFRLTLHIELHLTPAHMLIRVPSITTPVLFS